MPILTDPTPRAQQTYGGFKPKSDLKKFGVAWAAVEGGSDSRFPALGEICGDGIAITQQGNTRLKYEEAKFDGKPNDIVRGGVKLREVRVPIEEVQKSQQIASAEHNETMARYLDNQRTFSPNSSRTAELETSLKEHIQKPRET